MLDSLSDTTFALLLLGVIALSILLSFPLVESVMRHLEFLRVFRAQNRRLR